MWHEKTVYKPSGTPACDLSKEITPTILDPLAGQETAILQLVNRVRWLAEMGVF